MLMIIEQMLIAN